MSHEPVLQVAVYAPLSRLFDYLPPVSCGGTLPPPGTRVRVPFGRRKVTGLLLTTGTRSELPAARLRRVLEVLDDEPILDESDLWLIRFASEYYHHPIGEVVAAALPALLRQGKPVHGQVEHVALTAAGAAADPASLAAKAPRQAKFLGLLQATPCLSFGKLDEAMPGWKRLKSGMEAKGWIEIVTEKRESRIAALRGKAVEGPPLNADQAAALAAIRAERGFHVTLLDGVTGSGKTEVYLQLIDETVARGEQVLVLVPEIGLTPQFVARLEERLTVAPVVLHSSLSDQVRLEAWRAAREGNAPLILGTRSAIFTSMKAPGLLIVDEEHDASFKQQEGLRYSARDLAVARGKKLNIPVVLGSATPSFDSLQRCFDASYRRLALPARAGAALPPTLRLIDLERHPANEGLSQPVLAAISRTLQQGGQTLVFLNRRGFAPTLICQACGAISNCRRCDARMTVHAARNRLMCHHCGAMRPLDPQCPDCGGPLIALGQGTQRVESALQAHFGAYDITRIDSDTMRRKGAMDKALALAMAGDAQILVGTQMLSKGHHFPHLALVVVIDADQGLFSTDFRGSERLAQSLVQVAGRAGRERRRGEVLVQTAFASHPFWRELLEGGYGRVANIALQERELAGWPPFSRLALLRAAAPARRETHRFLDVARRRAEALEITDVRILGPVAAPMERKAGRYRAQLLFQSRRRQRLHDLLHALRPGLEVDPSARRVRWSIDVDPIELF
jgi:primosomal protein N' (replication factor Y) (superfamily II helicase)